MRFYATLILISILLNGQAQEVSIPDFIRKNALDLKSGLIFDQIKPYKCLMMGEMHGTKEPAALLADIVEMAARKGKKVILGVEIPANDMRPFITKKTTKNLRKTVFFSEGYGDGRNNEAWFDLIDQCKKLKNVELCFFDVGAKNNVAGLNRDSICLST